MTHETVQLSLPCELAGSLSEMALERNEAVGDLVRGMLEREVARLRSARASAEAREARVSRLRHLLAPEMRRATGWTDLQARLALFGVAFRIDSRGSVLHDLITGEPLCASSELGFGGPDLVRRFGDPLAQDACAAPVV